MAAGRERYEVALDDWMDNPSNPTKAEIFKSSLLDNLRGLKATVPAHDKEFDSVINFLDSCHGFTDPDTFQASCTLFLQTPAGEFASEVKDPIRTTINTIRQSSSRIAAGRARAEEARAAAERARIDAIPPDERLKQLREKREQAAEYEQRTSRRDSLAIPGEDEAAQDAACRAKSALHEEQLPEIQRALTRKHSHNPSDMRTGPTARPRVDSRDPASTSSASSEKSTGPSTRGMVSGKDE